MITDNDKIRLGGYVNLASAFSKKDPVKSQISQAVKVYLQRLETPSSHGLNDSPHQNHPST